LAKEGGGKGEPEELPLELLLDQGREEVLAFACVLH
jgi:hypothetical protein